MCSSNYPGDMCDDSSTVNGVYGWNEACNVNFAHPVTLNIYLFDVEPEYEGECEHDYLTIDGARYSPNPNSDPDPDPDP